MKSSAVGSGRGGALSRAFRSGRGAVEELSKSSAVGSENKEQEKSRKKARK